MFPENWLFVSWWDINVCFKEFSYSQRSLQNNIWKGFLHILKYDNCLTDKYVGLEEHNTYLN